MAAESIGEKPRSNGFRNTKGAIIISTSEMLRPSTHSMQEELSDEAIADTTGLSEGDINALNLYMIDVKRIPMLSRQKTFKLAQQSRPAAKEHRKLVKAQRALDSKKGNGESLRDQKRHYDKINGALKRAGKPPIPIPTSLTAKIDTLEAEIARAQKLLQTELRESEEKRKALIEANLRLVVAVAKRYIGRGIPLLDLIQAGNEGLDYGVDKFDETKGYQLSTYVTWWIRQAVARYVTEYCHTIHLPLHLVDSIKRLRKVTQQFIQNNNGREPSIEQLTELLGEDEARVKEWQRADALTNLESLDQPRRISEDSESTLGEILEDTAAESPEEVGAREFLRAGVRRVVGTLTPIQQDVIERRYGIGYKEAQTLDEAQEEMKERISRERVRQIQQAGLRALRRGERYYDLANTKLEDEDLDC